MSTFNIFQNRDKDSFHFDNYRNNELKPNLEESSINNFSFLSFEPNLLEELKDENNINTKFNIFEPHTCIEFNPKAKPIFITKKEIPKPILENNLIQIIKKMNINKETKINYISLLNQNCHKSEEIKEKVQLNPKGRRKKVIKKTKNDLKKLSKSGRKKRNDITIRSHDRYSTDNLINKIKNMINISLVLFCNKIIISIYPNKSQIKQIFASTKLSKPISYKKVIKDINYSFIEDKKKADEILQLFNITIKDYLCQKISSKYANTPLNYNTIIINQLLLDENNKKIFEFLFNDLTIEDWYDIFIYQKELEDFIKFETLNFEQKRLLNENLVRIDNYLYEIYEKDKKYFHCIVILIYNLKRFLMIKEKRSRIIKE